ncbi:LicD family protein [Paenibacillus sp. FSL P2-0536]|uniref:LicD family protein n=1 Tax=Paenibacillus sp. FSL P2-0536 TaxID=2921629 RepID=UPI0030FA7E1A
MSVNNTKDLQSKLLELMKVLHEVCVKNNITYYMLGGTMLGAMRHQGFIPWDDDMDIGLPREDYEKLLSLPKTEWPSFIHIKTSENSEDLIFVYSKLMDKNTTIVEDRLDGIIEGVYIDIFPLDGAGNSISTAKRHYYWFYWKQGLLFNNQDHGTKKKILRRLVQWYARKQNIGKLLKNAEKCLKSKQYNKSLFVGNFAGAWGMREIMDKKYMGTPKLYQFENTYFYGSENADAYLKSLYGEYMKLPPIENQKSHHNFIYLDLETPYSKYRK